MAQGVEKGSLPAGHTEGGKKRKAAPPPPVEWRWRPGVSGNPGGMPKVAHEVRRLAQMHGPYVIHRLRELTDSRDGKVAVFACKELLDRGYGRPSVDGATERQPARLFDASRLTSEDIETLKKLRDKMRVADTIDMVQASPQVHDAPTDQ